LKPRAAGLALGSLALLAATGCQHHFFKAHGSLVSDGGQLGTWRTRPEGCMRDPMPPPAVGQYRTVATLLWNDSLTRDHWLMEHSPDLGNMPGRVELWQRTDAPHQGEFAGRMEMQKPIGSVDLNPSTCSILKAKTSEGKPVIEGGRSTLQGTVDLDCMIGDSHVKGEVEFSGCEY
jgi:hypothetical protein